MVKKRPLLQHGRTICVPTSTSETPRGSNHVLTSAWCCQCSGFRPFRSVCSVVSLFNLHFPDDTWWGASLPALIRQQGIFFSTRGQRPSGISVLALLPSSLFLKLGRELPGGRGRVSCLLPAPRSDPGSEESGEEESRLFMWSRRGYITSLSLKLLACEMGRTTGPRLVRCSNNKHADVCVK